MIEQNNKPISGSLKKNLFELIIYSSLYNKKLSFSFIVLIVSTILFFIALSIFMVSYIIGRINYTPIYISDIQYEDKIDLEKLEKNMDEIDELLGFNSENQIDRYDDMKYYRKCFPGQCVIDKKSGLKKCPENIETLLYDTNNEACTRGDRCDYEELPYALNGDGSVNLKGLCAGGLNCPCVSKIKCSDYITSAFDILNGNAYFISSNQNNFFIEQDVNQNFGFENIEIDDNLKICRINPEYSDRLVNSTSIRYNPGDPLDCDNTWDWINFNGENYKFNNCRGNSKNHYNKNLNYKSMLLFTQPQNNICIIGHISYNIDRILTESYQRINNSRYFCQSNIVGFDSYLSHPNFYTLSCSLGDGCDDTIIGSAFVEGNTNDQKMYILIWLKKREINFFQILIALQYLIA